MPRAKRLESSADRLRAAKATLARQRAETIRKGFLALLTAHGLPTPEYEYKFCPDRRWRMDYAFPVQKVAIEVEGGVFVRGRHTRGVGFIKDLEKYSAALLAGWRVVRCIPDSTMPKDPTAPHLSSRQTILLLTALLSPTVGHE